MAALQAGCVSPDVDGASDSEDTAVTPDNSEPPGILRVTATVPVDGFILVGLRQSWEDVGWGERIDAVTIQRVVSPWFWRGIAVSLDHSTCGESEGSFVDSGEVVDLGTIDVLDLHYDAETDRCFK